MRVLAFLSSLLVTLACGFAMSLFVVMLKSGHLDNGLPIYVASAIQNVAFLCLWLTIFWRDISWVGD